MFGGANDSDSPPQGAVTDSARSSLSSTLQQEYEELLENAEITPLLVLNDNNEQLSDDCLDSDSPAKPLQTRHSTVSSTTAHDGHISISFSPKRRLESGVLSGDGQLGFESNHSEPSEKEEKRGSDASFTSNNNQGYTKKTGNSPKTAKSFNFEGELRLKILISKLWVCTDCLAYGRCCIGFEEMKSKVTSTSSSAVVDEDLAQLDKELDKWTGMFKTALLVSICDKK